MGVAGNQLNRNGVVSEMAYSDETLYVWLEYGRDLWGIQYRDSSRLADIVCNGHAIDCVQVREWDWGINPADQVSPVPTAKELGPILRDYVVANAEALA